MVALQILNFKQDIVEYKGNNCYNPTNGKFFIDRIKYLTGKGYTEEFLYFI